MGDGNAVALVWGAAQAQQPLGEPAFHVWRTAAGVVAASFFRLGDHYLMRLPALADFQIAADGSSVECRACPGVSRETAVYLFSNQVTPLVRTLRGQLVFHASAVAVGSGAVAFMGESGQGKSTLAAAFCSRGSAFLTDDILYVSEDGRGGYLIEPSDASIRLWDDSQRAVIPAEADVADPIEYTSKARVLAGERLTHCKESKPLTRVFILAATNADRPHFVFLEPGAAFFQLMEHQFLLEVDRSEVFSAHFQRLARLARLPIHYRLDYRREYDSLDTVCEMVFREANC